LYSTDRPAHTFPPPAASFASVVPQSYLAGMDC
jgi:hypothetical protein